VAARALIVQPSQAERKIQAEQEKAPAAQVQQKKSEQNGVEAEAESTNEAESMSVFAPKIEEAIVKSGVGQIDPAMERQNIEKLNFFLSKATPDEAKEIMKQMPQYSYTICKSP